MTEGRGKPVLCINRMFSDVIAFSECNNVVRLWMYETGQRASQQSKVRKSDNGNV